MHDRLPGAVDLFVHPTDRFKTSLVNILLHRPLDERTAAAALLPSLLRRGTRSWPNVTEISRRLETLFGAGLDVDVLRFGERQILSFRLDFVDDRYLLMGGRDLLGKSLDLLREVLLEPVLEGGTFPREIFEQERLNLRRYEESLENDRARYALDRCVRHKCEGEPYSRLEYGEPEEIDALTPADVIGVWRDALRTAPMEVYFVGRADPARLRDEVERRFGGLRDGGEVLEVAAPAPRRPVRIRRVREPADVVQARLVMGFRTDVGYGDPRTCPLIVWNTLFGGGSFSRLFRQVREKRSLAYYCSSSVDHAKGVAFVQAGIDGKESERVERIVRRELTELRQGRIDLAELRAAKEQLKAGLRSMTDSPARIAGFLQERRLGGWVSSFAEAVAQVARVRRADVSRTARSLALDTVYLLANGAA